MIRPDDASAQNPESDLFTKYGRIYLFTKYGRIYVICCPLEQYTVIPKDRCGAGHHPREAGLLSLRVLYCAFSWHVAGRQLGEPALMRAEGGLTRLQVGAPES